MTKTTIDQEHVDKRRKQILFHLVASYVSSGRPVSSTGLSIVGNLGFSPATIRRELHALSEMGYLTQPHTSAGRIPTDRALRLFVDTLRNETSTQMSLPGNAAMKQLRTLDKTNPDIRQETVRILSDFLNQAALVITPSLTESVIKQLRFIPFAPGSLLAVIITREGLVHNTYVKTQVPLNDRELERVHNYLGDLISGRTLNETREILRAELEDAEKKCDAMRKQATELGTEALKNSINDGSELVVDGRSRLAAQPELRDKLKELMLFLEEKSRILALLDQAAEETDKLVVIIGREGGESFDGCAMISAPFGRTGLEGQIGVVGSSRMDYSSAIPLVKLASVLLSSKPTVEEI